MLPRFSALPLKSLVISSFIPLILASLLLGGCGNRVKGLATDDNIPGAEPCGTGCEDGFVCVGNTEDPENPFFECVSVHQRFCAPCLNDTDCVDEWAAERGNICLTFPNGVGSFCATGCSTNSDCPENSYCDGLESGASVCRPESDECTCSEWAIENQSETTCSNTTVHGVCNGLRSCGLDGLTDCDARIPDSETCNGVDDNCDGTPDEAFPESGTRCDSADADSCNDGFLTCVEGVITCDDDLDSIIELCNGEDDDCDGIADNNLQLLQSNLTEGVCEVGRKVCSGFVGWAEPDYGLIPGFEIEETLCDNIDNDCDGLKDEPFGPEGTISFTSLDGVTNLFLGDQCGVGPCVGGVVVCSEDAATLTCSTALNAQTELCDDIDNNCDGQTDEDFDLQGDPANCGACNQACSYANALPLCSQGQCVMGNCNEHFGNCDADDANGCEANLQTSLTDCGSCSDACAPPNASAVCSNGQCTIGACNTGYEDCNGLVEDGCEVNLLNDQSHCGQCDRSCSVANGAGSCTAGICTLESCNAPYQDCDGVLSSGCETNTSTDGLNCGQCNRSCVNPHGATTCSSGQCAPSCDALWGSCDGNSATGCETSLATSNDCGSCGQPCDYPNASESCSTGTCQLLACASGYLNCDTSQATGCETEILWNQNNCGGCGITCTNPNGNTTCSQGTCNPVCAAGWSDCDGNPTNGCETNITTLNNCGGCGVPCSFNNGNASCSTGTCQLTSCLNGFADCDGNSATGCEIDTQNNPSHCGGCGAACSNDHGGNVCSQGSCSPTCAVNWENCDAIAQNGCETSLTTLTDCGSCNATCDLSNASESCSSATCQLSTCDNAYCDNNGNSVDGCEYDLDTDPVCDANSAINLGSVSGDGGGTVNGTYFGERWFKVLVTEDSNLISGLSLRVTVTPSTDTDYDLEIYDNSCSSGPVASSDNGGNSADIVTYSWGDSWGSTDDHWIYIRVLTYLASTCVEYTVTVEGDI